MIMHTRGANFYKTGLQNRHQPKLKSLKDEKRKNRYPLPIGIVLWQYNYLWNDFFIKCTEKQDKIIVNRRQIKNKSMKFNLK